MEIYKITDEVPEGGKGLPRRGKKRASVLGGAVRFSDGVEDAAQSVSSNLTITNLKQGVKNPNRVNVFINKMYSFSLDLAQVVDFRLKVGKVISDDELAEYKKASEFGKEYQRALEWALMRPRSVRELKDYLRKREIQNEAKERKKEWDRDREIAELIAKGEDVDAERLRRRTERARVRKEKQGKYDFKDLIIQRLTERGYVDDRKFAEYYAENRFVKKGVSQKRLRMELMKKGIANEVIEEVLDARSDEDEIRKIIARKRARYDDEKLIAYLCRQGFSYDLVRKLVEASEDDESDFRRGG